MTIAPLVAFFVFFGVCFCKFLEGQKLLYLYVKSFKQDLSWPLDDKLTKRYRTSSRIFAFYLYGTCRTNDKHLESLRVCNLVNEFRLAVLHTVILLVFAASCVSVFSLVLLVGDSSSSGKITGCAYSLTLLLIAKLYFSRFIKRRLLFYRKLLLFYGISVGELCKKMFFQFSVVYAIIGILVVLVMMPRNRKETEAAILVQPGTKLQWQPVVPPNNHSLSPKVSVAERPLAKIDVPRSDVSASDAIADFADNNRGGDDSETLSELNQLMDALLDLPAIPTDYGETMVALYRDKVWSQDEFGNYIAGFQAGYANVRGLLSGVKLGGWLWSAIPGGEPIGDRESIPMINQGFHDGQRYRDSQK